MREALAADYEARSMNEADVRSISIKICHKCGRGMSLDHFHKMSGTKDGRHTVCKECRAIYNKAYVKSETYHKRTRKIADDAIIALLNE